MKRISIAVAATASCLALTSSAGAHQDSCHRHHSCPSDHATYLWHGKRCVSPTARERTAAFRKTVRYGGRTYYCK